MSREQVVNEALDSIKTMFPNLGSLLTDAQLAVIRNNLTALYEKGRSSAYLDRADSSGNYLAPIVAALSGFAIGRVSKK